MRKHVSAIKGQKGQMGGRRVLRDKVHSKPPKQETNRSSNERTRLDTNALASSRKSEDISYDARPTMNRDTMGSD